MGFGRATDFSALVVCSCCLLFVLLTMVVCVTGGVIINPLSAKRPSNKHSWKHKRKIRVRHKLNYDAPLVDRVFKGTTVVPFHHWHTW